MLSEITPVILTLDEEANIRRTLEQLAWAQRVVIVDSGSRDATCAISKTFPNVEVFTHHFESHSEQWNFAVGLAASSWVLALDADHILPPELITELREIRPAPGVSAYCAAFTYVSLGHPLRGSLYPPKPILFRKEQCRFVQDGHTQRLVVDGDIETLRHRILHDDRKPFEHWLAAQLRYARLEAVKLLSAAENLSVADRLRQTVVLSPFLAPLAALFVRGTLLDGWPGIHYALQRSIAEALLSICLIQGRISGHLRGGQNAGPLTGRHA